jgi:predicted dehydrogenase
MEALWSRFNPAIQKAKHWANERVLGEVRFLYSEFSFYKMDADPSHRLMDLNKGGGALYDIGIYPIFLAYLILGIPKKIIAQSQFGPTGVDIQTSMIFQYKNAQAVLYCGITNNSNNEAKICGTNAEIILPGRWHDTEAITLIRNGKSATTNLPTLGFGYTLEINEVNQCISQGKTESSLWSNQNALELALLVEKVREISGIQK